MEYTDNALGIDFSGHGGVDTNFQFDWGIDVDELVRSCCAVADEVATSVGQDHTGVTTALPVPAVEETRLDAPDVAPSSSMSQEQVVEIFGYPGPDDATDARNNASFVPASSSTVETTQEHVTSQLTTSTSELHEEQLLYPLSIGSTPSIPDGPLLPDFNVAGFSAIEQITNVTTRDDDPSRFASSRPLRHLPGVSSAMQGSATGHFTFACSPRQQHMSYGAPPNQQLTKVDQSGRVVVRDVHGRAFWAPQEALLPMAPGQMPPLHATPVQMNGPFHNNAISEPAQTPSSSATGDSYFNGIASSNPDVLTDATNWQLERLKAGGPRQRQRKGKGKALAGCAAGPSAPSGGFKLPAPVHRPAMLNAAGLLTPASSQASSSTSSTPATSLSRFPTPVLGQLSNEFFPPASTSMLQSPVEEDVQTQNEFGSTPSPTSSGETSVEGSEAGPSKKRKADDSPTYTCDYCKTDGWDKKDLLRHITHVHERAVLVCPNARICAMSSASKPGKLSVHARGDALRRHYNGKHFVELGCRAAVEKYLGAPTVEKKDGKPKDWTDKDLQQCFSHTEARWADLVQFLVNLRDKRTQAAEAKKKRRILPA